MAFGVLNDKHMASPPGTVKIVNEKDDLEMSVANRNNWPLKRVGNVILQPQPSDDPNDPLNWSQRWKWGVMIILDIGSAVTISYAPLAISSRTLNKSLFRLGHVITPGLVVLAKKFALSMDTVASVMIGAFVFITSATTFFTASGANVWGKRPFFLLSVVLLLVTCVWGCFATSFPSLTAMRVLQGMASAPLETLVTSTVSDLFFIHQRGKWFSVWFQIMGCGSFISQIISGPIIDKFGPLAPFGFCAAAYLLLLPLNYFLVLETAWNGPRPGPDTVHVLGEEGKIGISTAAREIVSSPPARKPYSKRLAMSSGRITNQSFLKGVVKPIPLIVYPAVLFSSIVFGISFSCLAVQGVLGVTIFSAPPYQLKPSQIGLTNIPVLITHILTFIVAGFVSDKSAKYLAGRNSGILEPEFRLLLMAIFVPASTASLIGTGYAVRNGAPLAVLLTLQSLHAFAFPFAGQTLITYVVDCHPGDQNQAFVTISLFRSVIMFIATGKANGWYAKYGPVTLFNSIAAVSLGAGMLTIPAYVFGKRFRSWIARSKLAQKL